MIKLPPTTRHQTNYTARTIKYASCHTWTILLGMVLASKVWQYEIVIATTRSNSGHERLRYDPRGSMRWRRDKQSSSIRLWKADGLTLVLLQVNACGHIGWGARYQYAILMDVIVVTKKRLLMVAVMSVLTYILRSRRCGDKRNTLSTEEDIMHTYCPGDTLELHNRSEWIRIPCCAPVT